MTLELVKELLKIGAIKIDTRNPFTYASGLKGPIYCDNRMIISHPKVRDLVVKGFEELIEKEGIKFDFIGGIATAGIPHAAFFAQKNNLPMVYIRSKPKGHGKGRQVEGDFNQGQKILLVEDLINQASSLEKVVNGLRNDGAHADSVLCIMTYSTEVAAKRLESLKLNCFSLITFKGLADALLESEEIDKISYESMLKWQQDPVSWSNQADS